MSVLKKIYEKSNWKWMVGSIVLFGLFMAIVLPWISSLTSHLGDGPDTMFFASLGDYYETRMRWGTEGRRLYVILRWTFDVVWPLVYTFFYFMVIGVLGKLSHDRFGYKWLIIPVIAVLLDFLENLFASIFMGNEGVEMPLVIYSLMISSMMKWFFIGITFLVILYLLIKWVVKSIGQNRKQKTTV